MPCYGPCCTQYHSRMGTGEFGPRHVFDTTSSNTGLLSGACVILDQLLGRPLLNLGCRHHVLELVLAGGCCFWSVHGTKQGTGNLPVQAVWTVGINWSGRLPQCFFWWLCFVIASRHQRLDWSIDWLIEQGLTSPPTQYRLSGRQFYRSKTQPAVSKYWRKKRCKGKENPEKANNTKYSNTIKTHTENTSPLVYTNTMGVTRGWLP